MNTERAQKRPKNLARLLLSFGRILLRMANDELRRGHEFRTKTLSHACAFVMEGRPPCRPKLLRTGQSTSLQCFCSARMMKQILLRVTAMVPKVTLCERPEPRGVQFSRPREILFAQNPLDPDVDRERA